MNDSKIKIIRRRFKRKYGYVPKITEYKGRIYLSDPTRASEPYATFDNEDELWTYTNNN